MTLRKRGPVLIEMVLERETAHVSRVLHMDKQQTRKLVSLFFDTGKLERFKKALQKKMPSLNVKMSIPELYRYLANVFG